MGTRREEVQRQRAALAAARTRGSDQANTGPRLRPRSGLFRETVAALDASTSTDLDLSEAVNRIRSEYAPHEPIPIALVARCYLGEPYEVHICDLRGEILQHFERGKGMPFPEEGARALALHPDYAFVEVYSDATLVPVRKDGTVVVITTGSGA